MFPDVYRCCFTTSITSCFAIRVSIFEDSISSILNQGEPMKYKSTGGEHSITNSCSVSCSLLQKSCNRHFLCMAYKVLLGLCHRCVVLWCLILCPHHDVAEKNMFRGDKILKKNGVKLILHKKMFNLELKLTCILYRIQKSVRPDVLLHSNHKQKKTTHCTSLCLSALPLHFWKFSC